MSTAVVEYSLVNARTKSHLYGYWHQTWVVPQQKTTCSEKHNALQTVSKECNARIMTGIKSPRSSQRRISVFLSDFLSSVIQQGNRSRVELRTLRERKPAKFWEVQMVVNRFARIPQTTITVIEFREVSIPANKFGSALDYNESLSFIKVSLLTLLGSLVRAADDQT